MHHAGKRPGRPRLQVREPHGADGDGLLGPGGALFLMPMLVLPGRLDASGRGQLPLPVPELPALDHAVAFSQAFVLPPAGGLAASNGVAHALAAR